MASQLKIAVITGGFPQISETFILTHVAALIEAGYDVTIFSTGYDPKKDIHPIFSEYGMKEKTVYRPDPHIGIKRFLKIPFYLIKNIRHIPTLLKTFNKKYYGKYALKGYFFYDVLPFLKYKEFDIIHSHFGPNAGRIAFIRQLGLLKGKHLVTFHGHDLNDQREIRAQYGYAYLFNDLSGAICVVDFIRHKLLELTKNNFPIFKNPMSINLNKFTLKQNFNTQAKKIRFITIGRLIYCKGQFETVKLFKEISKSYNCSYTLIGDGEDYAKIENYISKNNLEDVVHLKGALPHEEVINELHNSHVHILYGRTDEKGIIDAQGTVIQESQATGTPVIVSDGGGLPEGLIENKTGLVVEENNIEELKQAILYFIKNPKEIKEMGINGRNFVKKNYSNEIVYKRLFDIYKSI